jgi:hypothetical protein
MEQDSKKKLIEEEDKVIFLNERLLVDDYENVIKWTLGDTYSSMTKCMKANDLKLLSEK